METQSKFLTKVSGACAKKQQLLEESIIKYGIRAMFAGAFLTLSSAAGFYMGDMMNKINPNMGKFFYAFLFTWGLVYILYLNSELATSNMMYLTAGVYKKYIKLVDALKILFVCTIFNLIGALLCAWLIQQTTTFNYLEANSLIVTVVEGKVAKTIANNFIGGILANIFVNIAILIFLLNDQSNKMWIIISAIFFFVILGFEHVVANFGYFGLAMFSNYQVQGLTLGASLLQWTMAFLGNVIGGGVVIGLAYAYINTTKTVYTD